jgi:hypothetical protein
MIGRAVNTDELTSNSFQTIKEPNTNEEFSFLNLPNLKGAISNPKQHPTRVAYSRDPSPKKLVTILQTMQLLHGEVLSHSLL